MREMGREEQNQLQCQDYQENGLKVLFFRFKVDFSRYFTLNFANKDQIRPKIVINKAKLAVISKIIPDQLFFYT